jgi:DUF4097 and DUF4098 domain-containing protein YvlB
MDFLKRIHFLFLMLAVALPAAALDVTWVKQGGMTKHGRAWEQSSQFEVQSKEGARLILRADAGGVFIHPSAGDKVTCVVVLHAYTPDEAKAREIFNAFQLSAHSAEAGSVYLTSQEPRPARHSSNFRVQFQLTVPARFNLDVESQGGDITVDAPLEGDARLTTAGGDVRASDITGQVRIETAGGRIETGNVGGELTARTAGGGIHAGDVKGDATLETSGGEIVSGEVGGSLHAETSGGDVILGGAEGPLIARTAGGQIQIGPTEGTVRAETAGGNIRLRGARGAVVAETAGGSIDLIQVEGAVRATTAVGRILVELDCSKKSCGASQLETSMGDVDLYLSQAAPVTIDATIATAAGRQIVSDFPLDIKGSNQELGPSTLHGNGNLNGGGEILKIKTVAGNIEIHKIDDATTRELQQHEESEWNYPQNHKMGKGLRRQLRHGGEYD